MINFKQTFFIWFRQIRGPFLVLAVVLVLVGAGMAKNDGFWNWGSVCLLIAGVTGAHASVNLFNELSDFRTGIDRRTRRTPFSGGSGLMQSNATSPKSVRAAAYGLLLFSGMIGVYFFLMSGWPILLFMVCGGLAVRFYTSHLAKWLLGEAISGLTLGSFVVLGVYYAMSRRFTGEVVCLSIPPGILTSLLLFLNEFPDAEADKAGGRKHLVIHYGKKKSAVIYSASLAVVYGLISAAPWIAGAPKTIWISLLTLPLAIKTACITRRYYNDFEKMTQAQGLNVAVVILTDLLLAAGYFLAV